MGLADVGVRVEDVVVGGRDVHVAAHDRRLRAGGDHFLERGEPGQLVLVVIRARYAPIRHVHTPEVAGGGYRAGLRTRKARRALDAPHHVLEPDPREDRHAVPGRLAVTATS